MNAKKQKQMELEQENEIIKLKLKSLHGMIDMSMGNVPPELENQWLKNMLSFEEQHKDAQEITVRERLGYPELTPADSLQPEEFEEEIDELHLILHLHNIVFDVLNDHPAEEIYRYMTTTFMDQKMLNMNIPGMCTCFIYEELIEEEV